MKKQKPIYKLVDRNGRVYLPNELREKAEIDSGDIVRLDCENGVLTTRKVYIVEVGDHTPEATEEFMVANFRSMNPAQQNDIIRRLCAALPPEENQ